MKRWVWFEGSRQVCKLIKMKGVEQSTLVFQVTEKQSHMAWAALSIGRSKRVVVCNGNFLMVGSLWQISVGGGYIYIQKSSIKNVNFETEEYFPIMVEVMRSKGSKGIEL